MRKLQTLDALFMDTPDKMDGSVKKNEVNIMPPLNITSSIFQPVKDNKLDKMHDVIFKKSKLAEEMDGEVRKGKNEGGTNISIIYTWITIVP